jgi:hypothetical protein
VNLHVHFTDGDSRTFEGIGGDVYRYWISGGALIVLHTRKDEPISNSDIAAAYGPSRWSTVDGLPFGNLGIEGLGEPAATYDVRDSVL